jgi:hypothetical protein
LIAEKCHFGAALRQNGMIEKGLVFLLWPESGIRFGDGLLVTIITAAITAETVTSRHE